MQLMLTADINLFKAFGQFARRLPLPRAHAPFPIIDRIHRENDFGHDLGVNIAPTDKASFFVQEAHIFIVARFIRSAPRWDNGKIDESERKGDDGEQNRQRSDVCQRLFLRWGRQSERGRNDCSLFHVKTHRSTRCAGFTKNSLIGYQARGKFRNLAGKRADAVGKYNRCETQDKLVVAKCTTWATDCSSTKTGSSPIVTLNLPFFSGLGYVSLPYM